MNHHMTTVRKNLSILFWIFVIITITYLTTSLSACPLRNCAPIISKCQLIGACRCEASLNHTCFKQCSHCLGDLYPECCSCVGICTKEDESGFQVKMLETTNEDLFDLFAADDDPSERWVFHHEPIETQNSTALNCKMAFLTPCVDNYKCESICIAMGASGYRWFHVGCCECFGKHCLNFGLNEIRCRNCPHEGDQVIDSINDDL